VKGKETRTARTIVPQTLPPPGLTAIKARANRDSSGSFQQDRLGLAGISVDKLFEALRKKVVSVRPSVRTVPHGLIGGKRDRRCQAAERRGQACGGVGCSFGFWACRSLRRRFARATTCQIMPPHRHFFTQLPSCPAKPCRPVPFRPEGAPPVTPLHAIACQIMPPHRHFAPRVVVPLRATLCRADEIERTGSISDGCLAVANASGSLRSLSTHRLIIKKN
jgi:hypothetical protein